MSSLVKSTKLARLCIKNHGIIFTAVRNHWNKDFKPAPYPKTREELAAAADKYNLPLADYKPVPDDGEGRGDYPDLPYISDDSKDPFYPYDYPELKRNFNEPIHLDYDLFREDRYDVSAKPRYSVPVMYLQFLATMAGATLLFWIGQQCKMFPAVLPKQYPKEGTTHYTFEPK